MRTESRAAALDVLSEEMLQRKGHEIYTQADGSTVLALTMVDPRAHLDVHVRYTAWGSTGVFTRSVSVTNTSDRPITIGRIPSLDWLLPSGTYDLVHIDRSSGDEHHVVTERLDRTRSFVAKSGRSTINDSPWVSLADAHGARYLAALAYSGNWEMSVEPVGGARITLGMRFDGGGALSLLPGRTFDAPAAAFTAADGDLDDVANRMHRYQRRYRIPITPTNRPLLVQINSWYPFPGNMTVEAMKHLATKAASLGAEVFVLDGGWYNQKNWETTIGDYMADPAAFPHGVEELAAHVHALGMKFGIWTEIETLGTESNIAHEHPDWCLTRDGKPTRVGSRYHLDFGKPEAKAWARATLERLATSYALDWIKIDYNQSVGDDFDPKGAGDVLYRHIQGYYALLDEMRAAHPGLVIEGCSSGGLRFDLGMLGHTHTTWLSDNTSPRASLALGYGCTVQFAPEVCNHWMVGDTDQGDVKPDGAPGYWDFMFRVPMNGQFGISSKLSSWPEGLDARAKAQIALYKRIRDILPSADTYHLTPQPSNKAPAGWMAIQYVIPDGTRSVVLAYRLDGGEPARRFALRGLKKGARYEATSDGRSLGTFTAEELASPGLSVALPDEWRASVVEITELARRT